MNTKEDQNKQVQKLWDALRRYLKETTQRRIRDRVVNEGWGLEKAVRNEGVMLCRHSLDLSGAKELFEGGTLSIKPVEKEKPSNLKVLTLTKEQEIAGRIVDNPVDNEEKMGITRVDRSKRGSTPDTFIPRPK